jgi:hypothetical protein
VLHRQTQDPLGNDSSLIPSTNDDPMSGSGGTQRPTSIPGSTYPGTKLNFLMIYVNWCVVLCNTALTSSQLSRHSGRQLQADGHGVH